jgi:hypothetical protein
MTARLKHDSKVHLVAKAEPSSRKKDFDCTNTQNHTQRSIQNYEIKLRSRRILAWAPYDVDSIDITEVHCAIIYLC